VIETEEQGFVEKLVAHPAVEAFTKAVLHRLSRRDEVPGKIPQLLCLPVTVQGTPPPRRPATDIFCNRNAISTAAKLSYLVVPFMLCLAAETFLPAALVTLPAARATSHEFVKANCAKDIL
jgi:hypothetical protein